MCPGKRRDARVKCVRPQAPHRCTARPDLQPVCWPLGERLLAVRTDHPGGQVGGLHLHRHAPGIIFEAAVRRLDASSLRMGPVSALGAPLRQPVVACAAA
jgi:hypothetical protein